MAILILLGAGASFGSEPNAESLTPPLGAHLFNALEALGGEASKVPDEIKQVFRSDFETGMALYFEKHSYKLQAFHRELSHFLSGFAPSITSFYVQLLNEFGKRNIVFSSLNYDMMLEEAAAKVGLSYHYDSVKRIGSVRVLKPHGSINFWPAIPASSIKNCIFEINGKGSAISSPVQTISKAAARLRCVEDDSLSPSISMYSKGKHVSVCPDFIGAQQNMFSRACRKASTIIALGVSVVPEDSHIWEPIRKSAAELIYFGNETDRVSLKGWSQNSGRGNLRYRQGYFEECLSFMRENI
ncbi:hypothetical protein [Pseudomonas coronafaciens]|uniref:SIR2-like domain-containing protein n=1 Tax=Pseudomonas coronafaciens pv. coronafaciens TaxID=235275 RepID=A0AAE6QF20_9PSED|nr:hypothetical protein [Pseudomonas coronafaciens]QGT81556.1 hypothetical protein GMO17_10325 [Pseudomonas coronafaciens pv. coronafaciens]QIQ74434.1 hypothetical protein HBB04_04854 [Pseudomonas coronafaciens]